MFDGHIFKHSLDHQIGIRQGSVINAGRKGRHQSIKTILADQAALEAAGKVFFNRRTAIVTGSFIAFDDRDIKAREQGCSGNASPHDAAANHTDLADRVRFDTLEFGQFGNRAFGKEDVTQRL